MNIQLSHALGHGDLVKRLHLALPEGYDAEPGFGVQAVLISLPDDERMISLAVGFNVDGWEAALDTGGEQVGLLDGPAADASVEQVIAWVLTFVTDPQSHIV